MQGTLPAACKCNGMYAAVERPQGNLPDNVDRLQLTLMPDARVGARTVVQGNHDSMRDGPMTKTVIVGGGISGSGHCVHPAGARPARLHADRRLAALGREDHLRPRERLHHRGRARLVHHAEGGGAGAVQAAGAGGPVGRLQQREERDDLYLERWAAAPQCPRA